MLVSLSNTMNDPAHRQPPSSLPRRIVRIAAAALFLAWLIPNGTRLFMTQNGAIRTVLSVLFSLLILARPKGAPPKGDARSWIVPLAAALGALLAVSGIVFSVNQAEWLGIILLLFACLAWSLPAAFTGDIARALFLLYWAHPIPGQLFGPLQLWMQSASVRGAEWFLHVINQRVWADGMVLQARMAVYEVPAWCSGMRTATTVFLLALGLGIIKRFRWHECLLIVSAALLQALALNVFRLSVMVLFTSRLGAWTWIEFLHDTAGIIVLISVFLVYVEISFLQKHRAKKTRRREELAPGRIQRLTPHPPFWQSVVRHRWITTTVILAIVTTAILVSRSRPPHRIEMIKGLATVLYDAGRLERAQRVAAHVLTLVPKDHDWRIVIARIQLLRGRYGEVIEELRLVPDGPGKRDAERSILRAYSLMALHNMEEAAAIVEGLPRQARQSDPRVAMILAEIAAYADDPDGVVRHLPTAARWRPNMRRIRMLYPFLRRHRRWETISRTDLRTPYAEPGQAFSAVEAYMNLDQGPIVANVVLEAIKNWPEDPRILEPLFYLAVKRPDARWEDRFGTHLLRCMKQLEASTMIYGLVDKSFALGRPDLAWALYRQLEGIDPSHPSLLMMASQYGDEWFSFRRRRLGLASPRAAERIDLRSFYPVGLASEAWKDVCDLVPLGSELSIGDVSAVRDEFLQRAVQEFERRDKAGTLSLTLRYEHVRALEVAGESEAARERLQRIAKEFPAEKERARIVLSEIFERQGKWQRVYEVLRGYEQEKTPQLTPLVRLCRTHMILRLGLGAVHVSKQAVRLFPESSQAAAMLAGALLRYDSPEESLFFLDQPRPRYQKALDVLEAEALLQTQRFSELETFTHASLLPRITIADGTPQDLFLPPAEYAAVWHWTLDLSDRSVGAHAAAMKEGSPSFASPFLRRLGQLWTLAYETQCEGESASPEAWLASGRDNTEKAVALSQLTLLLCWQERYVEARNAVGRAVRLLPCAPSLWKLLISLSGADAAVLATARRECPEDPDLWLAELVVRTQRADGEPDAQDEAWDEDDVIRALGPALKGRGAYSPATLTRAGDYLLRGGMVRAANLVAEHVVQHARGLLPAYVLGIRCAVEPDDREWALECTGHAIRASLAPSPVLYEKLVGLKSDGDQVATDSEMVEALKQLRKAYPSNPLWAQMLGYVRFQRGGLEIADALDNMRHALRAGATNRIPYAVAAEASRLIGNTDGAVRLLRMGLEQHPDDLAMLNNLAYTLVSDTGRVAEAEAMIPGLLERGADNPSIMDTVATIHLRAGRAAVAEEILTSLLPKAEPGEPLWFNLNLRLAEVAVEKGEWVSAETILKEALKRGGRVSDQDIISANDLLTRAEIGRFESRDRSADP
ncbi:MAG: archaeosortase/exosortase family protein [Lentisphaerae bacterium]|nr:archaeosortase/exosortase family protein [Lentisphaerota bacterium]